MKIKALLLGVLCVGLLNAAELKRTGWNLVAACQDINVTDIDLSGIEQIQAQDGRGLYQGEYAEYSELEVLEAGYGYWIKGNAGITFDTKEATTELIKPLTRDGWNLMASCEDITMDDINMSGIEEIQSQDGETIYTGEYAEYSSLDRLVAGNGYWIKGSKTTPFTAKRGIPSELNHEIVNNQGESIAVNYGEYTIKLSSEANITEDAKLNHTGIVVVLEDNTTLSTLNIQDNYRGHYVLVSVYDTEGSLVMESAPTMIDLSAPVTTVSIALASIPEEDEADEVIEEEKDRDATYQGMKVFATPLAIDAYGLESITDSDFYALSVDNQRIVANKLLELLFAGMPKMELDALIAEGKFISALRTQLMTPNSDLEAVEAKIENKDYHWSNEDKNREYILARLFNLGLGKEYINRWTAYVLTQSIMFSPAYELDTVDGSDISNVYNNLVLYMDDEYSMQLITFLHMISNDNWKRFRSPEDNGREMLEIFLYDFNDSHVPMAGIALKNWRLDRSDNELVIGLNQNSEPQNLFGTTVVTGYDFYRELAKSDQFLHGVTKRLVEIYFGDYSEASKSQMVTRIEESQPEQFQDILLQIVFSKEFLYNSTRVKSFEEAAFSMAKRLDFYDSKNYFYYMGGSINGMNQGSMRYKLGRDTIVPTDTLSFAYFYDFMRERLMVDSKNNMLNEWDAGWQQSFIDTANPNTDTLEGFIEYVFLTVVSRQPSSEERAMLIDYCMNDSRGYDDMSTYNDRKSVAIIVMEYLSRLSEVYTFRSVEE